MVHIEFLHCWHFHLSSKRLGGLGRPLFHLSHLQADAQVPPDWSLPRRCRPASAWNWGEFGLKIFWFSDQLLYSRPPRQHLSLGPVQLTSGQAL